MKPDERRNLLLEVVSDRNASVEQRSELCNVSEATIRRDLALLSKQRRLVRTYGGASGFTGLHETELSLEDRKRNRRTELRVLKWRQRRPSECLRQPTTRRVA